MAGRGLPELEFQTLLHTCVRTAAPPPAEQTRSRAPAPVLEQLSSGPACMNGQKMVLSQWVDSSSAGAQGPASASSCSHSSSTPGSDSPYLLKTLALSAHQPLLHHPARVPPCFFLSEASLAHMAWCLLLPKSPAGARGRRVAAPRGVCRLWFSVMQDSQGPTSPLDWEPSLAGKAPLVSHSAGVTNFWLSKQEEGGGLDTTLGINYLIRQI